MGKSLLFPWVRLSYAFLEGLANGSRSEYRKNERLSLGPLVHFLNKGKILSLIEVLTKDSVLSFPCKHSS